MELDCRLQIYIEFLVIRTSISVKFMPYKNLKPKWVFIIFLKLRVKLQELLILIFGKGSFNYVNKFKSLQIKIKYPAFAEKCWPCGIRNQNEEQTWVHIYVHSYR